jgi:hypothetical protein
MEVGDKDLLISNDGYHDWVIANENMAKVLAAKGYHYQFSFAKNAGHVDKDTKAQTLPEALEYVWQGYSPQQKKIVRRFLIQAHSVAPLTLLRALSSLRLARGSWGASAVYG